MRPDPRPFLDARLDRERAARVKFLYHVDVDDPLL